MTEEKTINYDENKRKDFEKAFELYWYKMKPFHKRLTDGLDEEREVCALFFETLNTYGMLDKVYPVEHIK